MSRTIFWYLLKDLLRVFVLTAVALAGIMSFCGLLRPLTEHGLDAIQVVKMLAYFLPAMSTYSLPVAALFATSMVYGRLAADNELTACRASGISYTIIGLPALVLGLTVALLTLMLLSYVVPVTTLAVQEVIYSNVARLIADKISRNHQIRFGAPPGVTVFAESAQVQNPEAPALPVVAGNVGRSSDDSSPSTEPAVSLPTDQVVSLIGPTIVTFGPPDPANDQLRGPKEIFMAEQATVYVVRDPRDESGGTMNAWVRLRNGTRFPGELTGDAQLGIDSTWLNPILIPSPIPESVKFMDVRELSRMAADPGRSERIRDVIEKRFIPRDEQYQYLSDLLADLNGPTQTCTLRTGDPLFETYILSRIGSPPGEITPEDDLLVGSAAGAAPAQLRLLRLRNGKQSLDARARQVRIRAHPEPDQGVLTVSIDMYDAMTQADVQPTPRADFVQSLQVAMPPDVARIGRRTLSDYNGSPNLNWADRNLIRREQIVVNNAIVDELHSRASFAVSCLILVIVGSALGVMFRSGNFLNAFAVSFLPALLSITLVVAGQRTADHVAYNVMDHFHNPLSLGLCLIWSGNAIDLSLATALIWKLQRH